MICASKGDSPRGAQLDGVESCLVTSVARVGWLLAAGCLALAALRLAVDRARHSAGEADGPLGVRAAEQRPAATAFPAAGAGTATVTRDSVGSSRATIRPSAPDLAAVAPPGEAAALECAADRSCPEAATPCATPAATSPPDYAAHVAALRRRVPDEAFTIAVEPPFVVIGDEKPQQVRHRARATVRWAVEKLKAAYFDKLPPGPIDIWLLRDKASYEKHSRSMFGRAPATPYGYYCHAENALVMNIATGGGTLVHEIVHPLIAADFPDCPAWFNEGLASLYEQSAERDGRIVGRTNWRLAGLQRAIRDGRVPSFRSLCTTTTEEFYEKDKGVNYAQARYLCYYLQEHDRLEKFYRAFRDASGVDPSGYETLQRVLGQDDMEKFQKEWEGWVLRLRFP